MINKYTKIRAAQVYNTVKTLTEYKDDSEREKEEAHQKILEAAMSANAEAFSNPSKMHRDAAKKAEKMMSYKDNFTKLGITEALMNIVLSAMPLDLEEYNKLNPNYKKETRDLIKGFLSSDKLNESIKDPDFIAIAALIDRITPDPKTYLKEDDEVQLVRKALVANVPAQLDKLSHDTEKSVANIVAKDQVEAQDQQEALDKAKEIKGQIAQVAAETKVAEDQLAGIPVTPVEDPDADDSETVPGDADAAPENTAPANDETDEQPASAAAQEPAPIVAAANEQYAKGIVESFALNEGRKMIQENKPFNKDLAVANSIRLITVLEAMNNAGLITLGKNGYEDILRQLGVSADSRHQALVEMKIREMTPKTEPKPIAKKPATDLNSIKEAIMKEARFKPEINHGKIYDMIIASEENAAPAERLNEDGTKYIERYNVIGKYLKSHPEEIGKIK